MAELGSTEKQKIQQIRVLQGKPHCSSRGLFTQCNVCLDCCMLQIAYDWIVLPKPNTWFFLKGRVAEQSLKVALQKESHSKVVREFVMWGSAGGHIRILTWVWNSCNTKCFETHYVVFCSFQCWVMGYSRSSSADWRVLCVRYFVGESRSGDVSLCFCSLLFLSGICLWLYRKVAVRGRNFYFISERSSVTYFKLFWSRTKL